MEQSLKFRRKKAQSVFYKVLFRFLLFKISATFYSKKTKVKKSQNLNESLARMLGEVFMELEGLFLKVAQQVSTMSNLLPNEYIKAFERAQNHSNPKPFHQIKERVELELGGKLEDLFQMLEEHPLGTASIGQVHKAILKTGEEVAVKVQHLKIDEIAKLDLELINKLLKKAKYFIKIPGIDVMFQEVVRMIQEELDYEHEATQIKTISQNLKNDSRIIVPKTFSHYSTKKVLTLEFVRGEKITNHKYVIDNGINREELAKNLLNIFSQNIFIDGIYHADPHPGNVLVNEKGQIILLDFGAVGILSNKMKEGLIILMQAAILKDENLMISGFKKMGFITATPGIDLICKKIIRLLSNYLQSELKIETFNMSEIKINEIDLSKVFKLIKDINLDEVEKAIQIPHDWILLNKTIALTMGITAEIAPQIDVFKEVKPTILKMAILKENLGMIANTTIKQQLLRIISLPRKIENFLEQAETGEIRIKLNNRKIEIKLFYALAQQVIFSLTTFGTYYFYTLNNNHFLLYGALVSAGLFIKSFIQSIVFKRKLH